MPNYYDGTRLLSTKDLDGKTPEIFMVTTNRTGGKTTYFSRLLINRFLKSGDKFMLIYRYKYELDNCADKFFKGIGRLFFKDYHMFSQVRAKGIYCDLYIQRNGSEIPDHCGYAIALNSADQIKKLSHLFSDTRRMFMDEFQSETNCYCPEEIEKFISVHTSVARGDGEMVRYLPVYMCANPVTMLNPYFAAMGISSRLDSKTRYLRGHGFVLEQGYVEDAANAQKQSGFNAAFATQGYLAYSTQGVYLDDNQAFVSKPQGKSRYLATLRCNNKDYAVRAYDDDGVIYCDDHPDSTFKQKVSVTTADHNINYVMLKANELLIMQLRWYFDRGCFRFKDLECKDVIMKALSY